MSLFKPNSIYTVTLNGPVVALIGADRVYAIGDTAYRFKRPDPFPNGSAQTLPLFATGTPVMWVDGSWRETQLSPRIHKHWGDVITVLEG